MNGRNPTHSAFRLPHSAFLAVVGVLALHTSLASAQRPDIIYPPGGQSSPNMKLQFHQTLVGSSDLRIEQDLSRPYVYQSHGRPAGFHILNIKDPTKASVLYSWQIENPELHTGGAGGGMIFKTKGRNYYIQSVQFRGTGPDNDLVAIVFDVTGLPDTTKVREVARIRNAEYRGGSHESFTYRHSDGRAIFMTTVGTPPKYGRFVNLYDMDRLIAGDPNQGLIGAVPEPEDLRKTYDTFEGYHDMYAAYDPARKRDVFYGAAWSAYLAYDISKPEAPKLIASISGVSGVDLGHTFMVDPTGRYAVVETETQYQPLRMFDLKPALDSGKVISRPIGAWTPNWKNLVHQVEIRWPYVFAAGYADGLHVFNMMDPANPYTVGFWDTYDRPTLDMATGPAAYPGANAVYTGAFGVDIRNADGLIVISDGRTGTWGFKMDGFNGWNGRQWGVPNISSAQDWDNGPDGAPKASRVS